MAEENNEQNYTLTKENGETGKSSRDYTGKGTAVYGNGEIYEGNFENGIRKGKGKYTYANGDKYDGDFLNNKKHGIGKYAYAGKPKEGDEEGKVVGKGEYYVITDGGSLAISRVKSLFLLGHFENGKRHGEGLFTYPNKDIYSGWWKYGKKHGEGTYVFNDTNMRLTGKWNENQIVSGRWIFPNGTYYEGKFKNNKPFEEGKWYFKNGNVLQGSYIQQIIANEDGQVEEGQPNVKLEWVSDGNIYSSALLVNSLENL